MASCSAAGPPSTARSGARTSCACSTTRPRAAQRAGADAERHPSGAGPHLTDLAMDSVAPFPFVPRAIPGEFGKVYEIRDYHLVPGGGCRRRSTAGAGASPAGTSSTR